jgi:Uma2 family endonuclease
MIAQPRATLDDLYRVEGQAELINERIVELIPGGRRPGRVVGRIYRSLDDYAAQTGRGEDLPTNVGFTVPELSSGRESFCPDASYYDGPPRADDMRFVDGPPTFAVEVRSDSDTGPAADAAYAAQRADYFEAGTRVVWDVDPQEECIRVYRPDAPDRPVTLEKGQDADAEPAVPGWHIAVADVFA